MHFYSAGRAVIIGGGNKFAFFGEIGISVGVMRLAL